MGDVERIHSADRPIAEPSAPMWAKLTDMVDMALEDPARFDRYMTRARLLLETHRGHASVMRARSAEYDEAVALEREKWANWLDIMEPVVRMQLAARA